MSDDLDFSAFDEIAAGDGSGTQVVVPVAFRYPTAWLSWQAVIGDLAGRDTPDARLRIEAVGTAEATTWTAEVEWGPNHERAGERPSLADALLDLWREVIDHHLIYDGDLSRRGPSLYEPHECLDIETQAVIQRLLGVIRSAFGADWAVSMSYHPVARADQRIHARLIAKRGEVAVSAGGATLTDGARALIRAAAPYFPKTRPVRG